MGGYVFFFFFSSVYVIYKRSIARNLFGRDMDHGYVFIGKLYKLVGIITCKMSYQIFYFEYLFFTRLSEIIQ